MADAILQPVTVPEAQVASRPKYDHWLAAVYAIALVACISLWLLAIRAPLWTDETLSYWQIAGGFKQIWARSVQGNSFAAYAYILWLTKTFFGDKEIVLRIPSILAMLGAVYVFYRCAQELFTWDVALFATMVFTLPRGIAFAAIDVRPYPFALLVTNLAILLFLRWTKTNSNRYAAFFGMSAGGIFYFHYLYASILFPLVVYYLATRWSRIQRDLPQIGTVLGCFAIVILPVLPRLKYIYQTRTMHSFAPPPQPRWMLDIFNPGMGQLMILAGVVLLALVAHQLRLPSRGMSNLFLSASLALLPMLCLYLISVNTSVHIFIPRYLLVTVPGTALCWGWLCSLIDLRAIRALFCFAFVGLGIVQSYQSPYARWHESSWKEALAVADARSSEDHAPILMCSPLVEADFVPMPAVPAESVLYSPLSYYKVSAPIVPLPRSLNPETQRLVSDFVLQAATEHRPFLLLAPAGPSKAIADFIAYYSQNSHVGQVLGYYEDIWVIEFVPRNDTGS